MFKNWFSIIIIVSLISLAGCGGGSSDKDESAGENIQSLVPNLMLVANAGLQQNVLTGTTVTLRGSGSSNTSASINYQWIFLSTPEESITELSDSNIATPTFTVDVEGEYELQLVVISGDTKSKSDSVIIRASSNSFPSADAGPDQNIVTSSIVTLNGANSSDPEYDSLVFSWSILSAPAGSLVTLSDPGMANPTFVADLQGSYVFRLVVDDGMNESTADFITVTASDNLNSAPIANAGENQTINIDTDVILDGSGSYDNDNDELSYLWAVNSAPAGSNTTLSDANTVTPIFSADVEGDYILSLIVSDSSNSGSVDLITLTLVSDNTLPTAIAGPDQSVTTSTTVNLDGSGSFDAGTNILSYSWSLVSSPSNNGASISSPNSATPSIYIAVSGTYLVQLIVNNGEFNSEPDTLTITVTDNSNAAPSVNAGSDKTVSEQTNVALSASAFDSDGSIVSYRWSQIGGNNISISNANSPQAIIITPTILVSQGTQYYDFQVLVTDNSGLTSSDTVTITATPTNNAPVISILSDQTVDSSSTVAIHSTSSDSDGFINGHSWLQTSGTPVTLSSSNAPNTNFTAPDMISSDSPQLITFDLTVFDNEGAQTTQSVTITVNPDQAAPILTLGADQTVDSLSVVNLTGTATDDGSIDIYDWQQTSGTTVTLANADTENASFTSPAVAAGGSSEDLTFTLTVTDNDGITATKETTITVNPQADSYGMAVLNWSAPTENTDNTSLNDLAGFKIYYGENQNTLDQSVTINDSFTFSKVIDNLKVNTTYYFSVSAFNSSGVESTRSLTVNKLIGG